MTDGRTELANLAARLPRLLAGTVLALAALWACTDGGAPGAEVLKDPGEVSVITLDPAAPSLLTDSVSFYAVRGEDREVELRFDSAGHPGDRLLRFEVQDKSLDRYPDGTKFKDGDSVLITIRVTDPATLAFDFQPSGLRFKSKDPARLTIGYGHALAAVQAGPRRDPGRHHHHQDDDDADSHAETDLAIWVQEAQTGPYRRLDTRVNLAARELETDIGGFSKYAVAY